MPEERSPDRAADLSRPTVASLGLPVRLVSLEQDTELQFLIERYEQLLREWEHLADEALTLLSNRPPR